MLFNPTHVGFKPTAGMRSYTILLEHTRPSQNTITLPVVPTTPTVNTLSPLLPNRVSGVGAMGVGGSEPVGVGGSDPPPTLPVLLRGNDVASAVWTRKAAAAVALAAITSPSNIAVAKPKSPSFTCSPNGPSSDGLC